MQINEIKNYIYLKNYRNTCITEICKGIVVYRICDSSEKKIIQIKTAVIIVAKQTILL